MFSLTCVIFWPAAFSHLPNEHIIKIHIATVMLLITQKNTYDGNLCVISLHQLIKPNVIIMAAAKVIKHDVMPNSTSKKSPKNDASNCLSVNRVILRRFGQNKMISLFSVLWGRSTLSLPVDFNARYEEQEESSYCGEIAIERRRPFHIEQTVVFVPIASGEEQTSSMEISIMTQHRYNDAQR